MSESRLREDICGYGRSLFERGLTFGSSGNISVRLPDGWLMTPTNVSLGRLKPGELTKLDLDGRAVSGKPPTKESFLHMAMYKSRPKDGAIVHLHSTHAVAVSCLDGLNQEDVLPPVTAYYAMRVKSLPLIPYYRPGDLNLARAVSERAAKHHAVLLSNHGPVVSGTSLEAAGNAIEELEETAKLFLLLRRESVRCLTDEQVKDVHKHFPS